MQEGRIAQLLEDVKTVVIQHKAENYKQGKDFNVFYVQGIAEDEVKVCRFIKELLDPRGSHGQGTVFLKSFARNVLKVEETFFSDEEYQKARITREERIDNSRRIDIVIRIKDRIFPLEVKIYAGDQERQCFDYYNYVCRKDPQTKVYYLTLDGHEPSDESKMTLKENQYECIAFSEEILNWLDDCVKATELEQIYPVRETIIQFRTVIRDLTGMQKGKLRMEIKDRIGSTYDNVMAAVQIANALPEIKADKMKEVFRCISDHMSNLGYEELPGHWEKEIDTYYGVRKKTWPGLSYEIPVQDPKLKGKLCLRFELEERLYFGICPTIAKAKTPEAANYIRENLTPSCLDSKETEAWYWWAYLHKDNSANYWHENDEYWKLFDESGFDEYMDEVYSTIDLVVKEILG